MNTIKILKYSYALILLILAITFAILTLTHPQIKMDAGKWIFVSIPLFTGIIASIFAFIDAKKYFANKK